MLGQTERTVKRIAWGLHLVAGVTILAIMTVTVAGVIGRYFFNHPLGWTVEVTQLGMVLIVYLGVAFTESLNGHVVVDILFGRFPKRVQRYVAALAFLFGISVVIVGGWQLLNFYSVLRAGGYSTAVLAIPIHYLVALAAFGLLIYGLTLVINMVKMWLAHEESSAESPSS